jgi:hypothetical protein
MGDATPGLQPLAQEEAHRVPNATYHIVDISLCVLSEIEAVQLFFDCQGKAEASTAFFCVITIFFETLKHHE